MAEFTFYFGSVTALQTKCFDIKGRVRRIRVAFDSFFSADSQQRIVAIGPDITDDYYVHKTDKCTLPFYKDLTAASEWTYIGFYEMPVNFNIAKGVDYIRVKSSVNTNIMVILDIVPITDKEALADV